MFGPGCRPSSRNIRACPSGRLRCDQENTARTEVNSSVPALSTSRRWASSASSAFRSTSGTWGRAAARCPATCRASGSRAHNRASSATATASASARCSPMMVRNSATASSELRTSRLIRTGPTLTARPDRLVRLVTTTRHVGEPGNSGRTCSALLALSSTTSIRRPFTSDRNNAARSCTVGGIMSARMLSARRNPSNTASGLARDPGS